MSTVKSPAGIQVQSVTSRPCSPNGSAWLSAGTTTAMRDHPDRDDDAPTGTISAAPRPNRSCSRRPNSAVKAKPEDRQQRDQRDQDPVDAGIGGDADGAASVAAKSRLGRRCISIAAYCRIASYSSTSGVFRLR